MGARPDPPPAGLPPGPLLRPVCGHLARLDARGLPASPGRHLARRGTGPGDLPGGRECSPGAGSWGAGHRGHRFARASGERRQGRVLARASGPGVCPAVISPGAGADIRRGIGGVGIAPPGLSPIRFGPNRRRPPAARSSRSFSGRSIEAGPISPIGTIGPKIDAVGSPLTARQASARSVACRYSGRTAPMPRPGPAASGAAPGHRARRVTG